MTFRNCMFLVLLAVLTACDNGSRRSEWDTLDYSGVYQRARGRDNDYSYRQPSVLGCVDDDLINCK